MAEIVDYDYLVAWAPKQLMSANKPTVDDMPSIISQAERRLHKVIDHDLFRTKLTDSFSVDQTPGGDVIDFTSVSPEVFEIRSLAIQLGSRERAWPALLKRNQEYLEMLYASGRSGRPRYYSEDEGTLQVRVFPQPNRTFEVRAYANQRPPFLGTSQATNIMTVMIPNAVEIAVVYQTALFNKNQTDIAEWKAKLDEAVLGANMQVGRRRRDETGRRPVETANVAGT